MGEEEKSPLLFRAPSWDATQNVTFGEGEVVRVSEDRKLFWSECERAKLVANDKKLEFLGKQGQIVFVDGNTAKVKFTKGESFFPLAVLRPIADLPNNIKETIEQCFYC